jgi:UDP-glucuronate 4-epimerase
MATAVVTGVAGFIGSHLAESLLGEGDRVVGIDSFTDYYDPGRKHANLAGLRAHPAFELIEADLASTDLVACLEGADVVFHLAGQPGVRGSWAEGFAEYCDRNVLATQRLLEAARTVRLRRLVYASSSSVYGNAGAYPVTETSLPRPHSPYGVTKLAGEHLCGLYAANWSLATVSLRYFTVYGPRQRPDMAIHRVIEAALGGTAFPLYGDGSQLRDFTYVGDVVAANMAAAAADAPPGTVCNVAGGSSATMLEVLNAAEEATGSAVRVERHQFQAGDVGRTGGSTEAAERLIGWRPSVPFSEGLRRQVAWHRGLRGGPC